MTKATPTVEALREAAAALDLTAQWVAEDIGDAKTGKLIAQDAEKARTALPAAEREAEVKAMLVEALRIDDVLYWCGYTEQARRRLAEDYGIECPPREQLAKWQRETRVNAINEVHKATTGGAE